MTLTIGRIILLALVGGVVGTAMRVSVDLWSDRSIFNTFNEDQKKEDEWAYGSVDDAIKVAQTILSDPNAVGVAVHRGPNAGSWIINPDEPRSIKFRDVRLVYKTYKDYKEFRKWLRANLKAKEVFKPVEAPWK